MPRSARRATTGRQIVDLVHDTKRVNYLRATRNALSAPQPESVHLDGNDSGLALAVNGSLDPGVLLVRVLPE